VVISILLDSKSIAEDWRKEKIASHTCATNRQSFKHQFALFPVRMMRRGSSDSSETNESRENDYRLRRDKEAKRLNQLDLKNTVK
jgi:hypothetical protein